MRKLRYLFANLSIIFSIIFAISPVTLSVSANTDYRRIITEDTPFYSDASGTNLLFYLPYTYYVKVLEQGEFYSHVECFGTGSLIAIDGYVPTSKLFDDGLPVQNPYMEKEIITITTAVLYQDKSLTTPLQYLFSNRSLKYYGQLKSADGSLLFYVGYNNKLGYVQESTIAPFELPLHPNELTFISPESPPDSLEPAPEQTPQENQTNNSSLTTIRIVVISCLLLAGIIALLVAVKNNPNKRVQTGYYDENEYE